MKRALPFFFAFFLLLLAPGLMAAGCGDGICGTFEGCGQINECEQDCGVCYTVFDEPLCKINEWEARTGNQKGAVLDIDTVHDGGGVTAALATNGFGVFITEDHGESFEQLISTDLLGERLYTVALARDYRGGGTKAVYVGTNTGVWRWLDDGFSQGPWTQVLATTFPVRSLSVPDDFAYNGAGEQHIYAAVYGQGIWVSKDAGDSWIDLSSSLVVHLFQTDVMVAPDYSSAAPTSVVTVSGINPSAEVAGGGRVHHYDVGENQWTHMLLPDGIVSFNTIAMSSVTPFDGDVWVAGNNGKIYYTVDITQATPTWQTALAIPRPIYSLALSPLAVPGVGIWDRMLIGTSEGAFQSNDGGFTLAKRVIADRLVLSTHFPSFYQVSSNRLVYAGTTTGFVVGTFGQANCAPKERSQGVDNLALEDLVTAPNYPTDPSVFAVSSALGLLKSHDRGETFVAMNNFRFESTDTTTITPEAVAVDITNTYVDDDPAGTSKHLYLATLADGVFRSEDGGWSGVQVLGAADELSSPEAKAGTSIDISPNYAAGSIDGTVILGTAGAGVWKYNRSGDSWCQLGEETIDGGCPGACAGSCSQLPDLWVYDVQASNTYSGNSSTNGPARTIFAGTRNGLYRTQNGGDNWAQMDILTLLPEEPVEDVALSANFSADGVVFAVVRGLGVYRSTNGHNPTPTWSKLNLGATACDSCLTHVALAPDFGTASQRMAVGSKFGKIFYSTDGGDNWVESTGTGLPGINKQVRMLEVSRTSTGGLTEGIWVSYPGQTALLSDDGGTTFQVSAGYTTLPPDVSSVAFASTPDPTTDETPLWAASPSTGLFISFDGGQAWRPFTQLEDNGGNPFLGAIGLATTIEDTLCDGNQETLLVGTVGRGLHAFRFVGRDFRQADPPQTFSNTQSGIFPEITPFSGEVCGNGDPIFASSPIGVNQGLFKSVDGGLTWTKIINGLTASSSDSAFGDDGVQARPSYSKSSSLGLRQALPGPTGKLSNIIWSSSFTNGVSVSNNSGVDWTESNGVAPNDLPNTAANTVIQLSDTTVLTGLNPDAGTGVGGVFWTPDEGATTWVEGKGLDATTEDIQEFVEVEANGDVLCVIEGTGGATDGGVYLSGDQGRHWIDLGTSLDPTTQTVTDVIASAETPVTYYIGTSENGVWANSIEANPYPTVTSLDITSGASSGGDTITVTGTNFDDSAGDPVCVFGGVDSPSTTFVNDTTVTCTSPVHVAGLVDVAVRNADTRQGVLADAFTYSGSTGTGSLVLTRDSGTGDITVAWSGSTDGIFEVQRSTDPSDFSGATTMTIYYATDFIDEEASGDNNTYYYLVE